MRKTDCWSRLLLPTSIRYGLRKPLRCESRTSKCKNDTRNASSPSYNNSQLRTTWGAKGTFKTWSWALKKLKRSTFKSVTNKRSLPKCTITILLRLRCWTWSQRKSKPHKNTTCGKKWRKKRGMTRKCTLTKWLASINTRQSKLQKSRRSTRESCACSSRSRTRRSPI